MGIDLIKTMYARHSVRHFDGQPLKEQDVKDLNVLIDELNTKYDMHMQLMVNEPLAFSGRKAKISNITGCVNYLVIISKKCKEREFLAGYVGEQIVLKAQSMGINSCWVALTYNKQKDLYKFNEGEKLTLVIALGYGTTQGKQHESKSFGDVCANRGKLPQWFIYGVKMALIAPTGKNQQKFMFELVGENGVYLKNRSCCGDVDKGIIKYHFELGAGTENFHWVDKK